MSRPGPLGYDVGVFLAYPLEIAMFFAAQKRLDDARGILTILRNFWKTYSIVIIKEGGKDETGVRDVLKNVIAGLGWGCTVPLYCMGLAREDINQDGLSEEEINHVVGIFGLTGLKCFEYGYMDDTDISKMTLKQLEVFLFEQLIDNQLEYLCRRSSANLSRSTSKGKGSICLPSSSFSKVVRRLSSITYGQVEEIERRISSISFGPLDDIRL
mmetsp:Transcript_13201/g.23061  ORF Transcript_13201/g.23061 Transcript_13201/m.23061 type:complete len:213 (+) Transcript_13201:433-1071(+)